VLRSAARAALDLRITNNLKTCAWQPHSLSAGGKAGPSIRTMLVATQQQPTLHNLSDIHRFIGRHGLTDKVLTQSGEQGAGSC
jgi:hypothetical protein